MGGIEPGLPLQLNEPGVQKQIPPKSALHRNTAFLLCGDSPCTHSDLILCTPGYSRIPLVAKEVLARWIWRFRTEPSLNHGNADYTEAAWCLVEQLWHRPANKGHTKSPVRGVVTIDDEMAADER